jgi:hypothetical protein
MSQSKTKWKFDHPTICFFRCWLCRAIRTVLVFGNMFAPEDAIGASMRETNSMPLDRPPSLIVATINRVETLKAMSRPSSILGRSAQTPGSGGRTSTPFSRGSQHGDPYGFDSDTSAAGSQGPIAIRPKSMKKSATPKVSGIKKPIGGRTSAIQKVGFNRTPKSTHVSNRKQAEPVKTSISSQQPMEQNDGENTDADDIFAH